MCGKKIHFFFYENPYIWLCICHGFSFDVFCCLNWPKFRIHTCLPHVHKLCLLRNRLSQRPGTDLYQRSKLKPQRSNISKIWNLLWWNFFYFVNEFECNYCKAVFALVKNRICCWIQSKKCYKKGGKSRQNTSVCWIMLAVMQLVASIRNRSNFVEGGTNFRNSRNSAML